MGIVKGGSRRATHLAFAALLVLCFSAAIAVAADHTDRSFGKGGTVVTQLPETDPRAGAAVIWDLALAPEGAIVGAIGNFNNPRFFGAVRYRPDGALDRSFGERGFTAELGLKAQAQGIAVEPDGSVVEVGFGVRQRQKAPVIVRFRPDGRLDPSFGHGGVFDPKTRASSAELHDVAIGTGGRIIAVGARGEGPAGHSGSFPVGVVYALLPDGHLDRRFGNAGRVFFHPLSSTIPRRPEYTGLGAVALLPAGKIVVSGFREGEPFVARLFSDGRLDRTFGDDGTFSAVLSTDSGCDGYCPTASRLAILPDGRIVFLTYNPFGPSTLFRLMPDGRPDRTFGHDGKVVIHVKRAFGAYAMAVDGEGRIVVGGMDEPEGETKLGWVAVRFLPDGRPDRDFGEQRFEVGPDSGALAALTQADGSVVVAGGGDAPNTRENGRAVPVTQLTRYR